jgi:hypothetical protein
MRKRWFALAAFVAALVTVGIASADDGGRPFTTALTGAAEVPGPGDPNASGTASLRLNQGQEEVCFDLSWADVDGTVFASHIHVGDVTSFGDVVVPLFVGQSFSGTGSASGCAPADAELIKAIRQNPEGYYVNVHSLPSFGPGAIRGQLSK